MALIIWVILIYVKMITAASKSGADAVKLQTIEADESYMRDTSSFKIFNNKSFSIEELKN